MTKVRSPLTFERALTRIAGQIGWGEVAAICRRNERTVRKWSEEDVRVGIKMESALHLDVAYRQSGGDGAPMLQAYALRLESETAAALADSAKLAETTAEAAKECGEAIANLVLATRPGATRATRLIAMREVEEAVDALSSTLPMLDSAGESDGSDAGPGGPR